MVPKLARQRLKKKIGLVTEKPPMVLNLLCEMEQWTLILDPINNHFYLDTQPKHD